MKKITIKNLIDFRRKKTPSTKKTFINNLKKEKKKEDDMGGNYWSICLGAIGNVFKYNDFNYIHNKVEEFAEKIPLASTKRTKDQYQKNIDILLSFEDFEFNNIRPNASLNFPKQSYEKKFIDIKGFPVQVWPNHVFTFTENGSEEIGAVWFVAKKDGYQNNELGMFADIIFRYLDKHYSKDYFVNSHYCLAVDVVSGKVVNYTEILEGHIPVLIERTIDEISSL